jgi:hypothetical protein
MPTARVAIDEAAARDWCNNLALLLPVARINRFDTPYLERYTVFSLPRGPSVYLHHFRASDPYDVVHSHPWNWAASLILAGGYREYRIAADGVAEWCTYRPGDLNTLTPDVRHRIELVGADCWSIFLAGPFLRKWEFSSSFSDITYQK